MTCKQLGGACDKKFQAKTFEEIVTKSKQHGLEMFHQKDASHLEAMAKIQILMQSPHLMKNWFESKLKEFYELPEE